MSAEEPPRRVDVRTEDWRVNTAVYTGDGPEDGPVVVVAWDAREDGAEAVMGAIEDARKEIGHQVNAVDSVYRAAREGRRERARADGGEADG